MPLRLLVILRSPDIDPRLPDGFNRESRIWPASLGWQAHD